MQKSHRYAPSFCYTRLGIASLFAVVEHWPNETEGRKGHSPLWRAGRQELRQRAWRPLLSDLSPLTFLHRSGSPVKEGHLP